MEKKLVDAIKKLDKKDLYEMEFVEILKLFSVNNQLYSLMSFRDKLTKIDNRNLPNEAHNAKLEEFSKNCMFGNIYKLEKEELDEIFSYEGEVINLPIITEDMDDEAIIQARREYISFKKNLMMTNEAIDGLNDIVKKELLQDMIDNKYNLFTLIRNNYSKFTDASTKKELDFMLAAEHDALTLSTMKDTYSKLRSSNQLHDYNSPKRIKEKYMKMINKFAIKSDIGLFKELEAKFLPEEYHANPDLFAFLVEKFLVYRKSEGEQKWNMMFNVCLVDYLRRLVNGELGDDDKNQIIESMKEVLDYIYK